MNVLVVEDEDDLRQAITDYLQMHGISVLTADSSKSAVAILKENRIDLIISDVHMPLGGGEELLKIVNTEFAATIPVVLVSGYSEFNFDSLIAAGAMGVLQKPFHPQRILEYIIRLKDRSSTHKS